MTRCQRCLEEHKDAELRWAFDMPYCEDCFDENFSYCSNCDTLIYNSDARYNEDGDAYCSECYEEDYDYDCPHNPNVDEADRQLVVSLARSWLKGEVENRKPIFINKNDLLLREIKEKVGLVDNPIYIFGLADRPEYQLTATEDIYERVKEYVLLHGMDAKVISSVGCNRLGISQSLRQNCQKQMIALIKSITKTEVLCAV